MTTSTEFEKIDDRKEAIFGIIYFILYLGYLFVNQETDWLHWVSLVGLPLLLLTLYHTKIRKLSFKLTLESCGLRKSTLKNGLAGAIVLGLGLSVLQLFISQRSDQIWRLIYSGKVLILLPLAFVLLILTAGFTEEFFFRGVLLTRLEKLFGSKLWGIVISSILFGLYHVPYAYLDSNWSSHGNLSEALMAALGQGIPGGLVLGLVYVLTKNNLVASVLVHSLINLLPAMTMIKFSGS